MCIFETTSQPKVRTILVESSRSFMNNGYHGVSMRDIADQVGLQKGSLYHYFSSKIELAIDIVDKLKNYANNHIFATENSDKELAIFERLFHPERNDLDMQLLAILPLSVATADDRKLQQSIREYYRDWSTYFNQRQNEMQPHSNKENNLYAWIGYWCMAGIISD